MINKSVKEYRLGGGVVLLRDGKFLLGYQIRSYEKPCWGTPGGKVNDKHCSIIEAMKKEVYEETGINVRSLKKLTWYEDVIEENDLIGFQFYTEEFDGEARVMEPEKCKEWKWFDIESLPEKLTDSVQRLVDEGLLENLPHSGS